MKKRSEKTFGQPRPTEPTTKRTQLFSADWTNELASQKVPLYAPNGKPNENNLLKRGGKIKNKFQAN